MEAEIAKVEQSSKNADVVILTMTNGLKVSGFATNQHKPTGIGELKVGDVIDFEPIIKGQYKNITSFTKLDSVPLPPPQSRQAASTPNQGEVSGPERGLALKEIGEMIRGGKILDGEPYPNPLGVWYWKELHRIAGTGK